MDTVKAEPIKREEYRGYTLSVWPQSNSVAPFYSNAIKDNGKSSRGFGGMSGKSVAECLNRAKQAVDSEYGD